MQNFVDLGCGNGFLVYLLVNVISLSSSLPDKFVQEGHPGKGIDISERKIWKMYDQHGAKLELEKKALFPDNIVFNNVDWLIGNHSGKSSYEII